MSSQSTCVVHGATVPLIKLKTEMFSALAWTIRSWWLVRDEVANCFCV